MHRSYRLILAGLAGAIIATAAPHTALAQDREADIVDVSLETLLQQKVSAASKHEQSAHRAPASVTVISAEEIRRFGYENVAEVLEAVHGLYINNDLKATSVGVRGFGRPSDMNSRVLVLVDGHPTNESATNWTFIDFRLGVDIDLVDRIEIVRGPGSALYGTGAMMAVINVVTKRAEEVDGIDVTASAGSYGYREGHVSVGKTFAADRGIIASATWGATEGHNIYFKDLDLAGHNNGIAEQQDWKEYHGLTIGAMFGGLVLRGRQLWHNMGDPTGTSRTVFNHDDAQQNMEIGLLEALYRKSLTSSTHLSLGTHLNRASRNQIHPVRDSEQIVLMEDVGTSTWTGVVGDIRWDASPVHRVVAGGELKTAFVNYRRWTPEDLLDDDDYNFRQASVFIQDEYSPLRDLTATIGIRFDYYDQAGGAVSPRVAVVYSPFRTTTLKALYGHAFRSPSIVELHWSQKEVGFIGNPNLKPERGRTFEVVWEEQIGERTASSVALYHYAMDDLIEITFDGAKRLIQYQNRGEVNALGAEFAVRAHNEAGVLGYGSYSFQRARQRSTGDHLVSSPEHLVKGGLSIPVRALGSAGAEVRYESRRYTVFRTITDAFWLVDLVARTAPLLDGHVAVSARMRNVFNTRYALPGNPEHRQLALTQLGRRFTIELRYRF